jgi:hypothetical protein
LHFLLMVSLFKIATKCSAKVFFIVPEYKAVMYLTEKNTCII